MIHTYIYKHTHANAHTAQPGLHVSSSHKNSEGNEIREINNSFPDINSTKVNESEVRELHGFIKQDIRDHWS